MALMDPDMTGSDNSKQSGEELIRLLDNSVLTFYICEPGLEG